MLSTFAFSSCDLSVASVQTCDAAGNPVTLHLGDTYYGIRLNWNVSGNPSAPYSITFRMGDKSTTFDNYNTPNPGNGYWSYFLWTMPLDGTISYTVTIDPHHTSGDTNTANNVATGSFTPVLPTKAVTYYGTQRLYASQTFNIQVPPNADLSRVAFYFGRPVSWTSQNVIATTHSIGPATNVAPFNYPISSKILTQPPGGTYVMKDSFTVDESNVMINVNKINANWTDMANLPSSVTPYLQPEALIESNDPSITAFVNRYLPANFKSTMKPISAARALFKGVAKEMAYVTPFNLDAVQDLALHQGDCGCMSAVYIAAMRNIGIPARMCCGWLGGTDQWHCWTEIYIAKTGWIPQDVTNCDAYSPSGAYSYCFACVPDLNDRISVARGSTFLVADGPINFLQVGALWYFGNGPYPSYSFTCSLGPTP